MELEVKEQALRAWLKARGRVAIGFSGGVDSALLLRVAVDELGAENVLAVIADTPSLPRAELADARRLAADMGVEPLIVDPNELGDPRYASNPIDRCYYCKSHLFKSVTAAAQQRGIDVALDGNNADDIGDYRPGMRAAREWGVISPLLDAGLTKQEVRELSRRAGLSTATKPAMACLASRVPYGTPVTAETLAQIEQAEAGVRAAGFPQCRVRHHGVVGRVETPPDQMGRMLDSTVRNQVVRAVKAAGYSYVALDLEGYRAGSLNEGAISATGVAPSSGA